MNIHNEDFVMEFFAYNISVLDITKKIYVRVLPDAQGANKITLSDEQLQLISFALDNKYLSSFQSDRYSLYDVSFRELNDITSIGFSFKDVHDYTFIEPLQVFKPFKEFNIDKFINTLNAIEKNMFRQIPQFNPISMIGMVTDDNELKSLKAYIRYDLEEASTFFERRNIMEAIIKAINSKIAYENAFLNIAEKLESLGFIFSFVGVDSYAGGVERYKMYFRFYEEKNCGVIAKEIKLMLLQLGLNDSVQNIFIKHENNMGGIALSTDSFEYVKGVQLYFYP